MTLPMAPSASFCPPNHTHDSRTGAPAHACRHAILLCVHAHASRCANMCSYSYAYHLQVHHTCKRTQPRIYTRLRARLRAVRASLRGNNDITQTCLITQTHRCAQLHARAQCTKCASRSAFALHSEAASLPNNKQNLPFGRDVFASQTASTQMGQDEGLGCSSKKNTFPSVRTEMQKAQRGMLWRRNVCLCVYM
eukprot:2136481-Pleurochrysis_carterae.AAC.3